MMSGNLRRNARIPAAAFTAVALFIGLAILALQLILWMELSASELWYFCTEDRSTFCFVNFNQASTISRAPWAFLVGLALLPGFLAVLVARLQNSMPPNLKAWVVAAMWLAFAFYLAAPIIIMASASSFSGPAASDGWVLYPPLSTSSYQPDAILNSLQMNKLAVAILLILNLFGFTVSRIARPRSTRSKAVQIGFITLMIWVIWMAITWLSDFLKFISLDRNFGTTFFDPASQAEKDYPTLLLEYLDGPGIWYLAAVFSCLALWISARRS
ncbi:hypothetical protein DC366_15590 [Pelagivirga sediminicola]|uniref:Cytochrome oxidase subunit I profile domain-containing protein n=1 Tax=Pelagivirga sediminicola TaxID=2170575 RepID=A0A2T7G406_9RHOB|nr:hypothetical protein [Pelagivirga sediminicola]PVA09137.1 hypothetical protein DC366_15590 [Pelagivirga sediminicola]